MEAAAFRLQAVAHLIRPWGRPARDLEELRLGIAAAPDEVVFLHTVQFELRHPGAEELPPDDLSAWIGGVVQDPETAERMSFAVQSANRWAAAGRAAILEALERVPAAKRRARAAPEESAFVFLSATSIAFATGAEARDGAGLVDELRRADAAVWFHHLREEPWFREGRMPLAAWAAERGEPRLVRWLEAAAGAGLPIEKARGQLVRRWRRGNIARRLSEATAAPEEARREVGRRTMARLVRRVAHGDGA